MVAQRALEHLPGIRAAGRRVGGEQVKDLASCSACPGWVTSAWATDFPVPQFPHVDKEDKSRPGWCHGKRGSDVTAPGPQRRGEHAGILGGHPVAGREPPLEKPWGFPSLSLPLSKPG